MCVCVCVCVCEIDLNSLDFEINSLNYVLMKVHFPCEVLKNKAIYLSLHHINFFFFLFSYFFVSIFLI